MLRSQTQWTVDNLRRFFNARKRRRRSKSLYQPEALEPRVLLSATIGNRVWNDLDGNGYQNAGEPGIPQVRVQLFQDGQATPLRTTWTDNSGYYTFRNVAAGSYVVNVTTPDQNPRTPYSFTAKHQFGERSFDSDINPDGNSDVIVVGDDDVTYDIDAGILDNEFIQTAEIGDLVWADVNGNGIRNGGEPGLAGVTVNLIPTGGTDVFLTTTTNSDGKYLFTDVPAGLFDIEFVPATSGFSFTKADQGGFESFDSDAGPDGIIHAVSVAPGQRTRDLDAGLLGPGSVERGALGNRVWNDLNGNGRQDGGEPGVGNVEVQLLSNGVTARTTQTDSNGFYLFQDLIPKDYQVQVIAPDGWSFTLQNAAGIEAIDSDVDATGLTDEVTVGPGSLTRDVAAGLIAPGNSAGTRFIPNGGGRVGDRVWNDLNGNGVQDRGEPGLSGVTVELFQVGSATALDTQVTNAAGRFVFTDLATGDYAIAVSPVAGFNFTSQFAGVSRSSDSDADAAGVIGPFSVNDTQLDLDYDAGMTASDAVTPGRVGGRVFQDRSADGRRQNPDGPISDVEVQLIPDDTSMATVTTDTDSSGRYRFSDVAVGTYTIQVVSPGSTFTLQNATTESSRDSDADASGAIPLTVTAGLFVADLDIGIVPAGVQTPVRIGSRVWDDLNHNGIQDRGELGISGVTVNLYRSGATPVATTTTGPNGRYVFANRAPGTYSVEAIAPAGWSFTSSNVGGAESVDSDADSATGRTADFTVSPGEAAQDWDFGLLDPTSVAPARISNLVWNDVNGDGIRDPGEPGMPGVQVRLLEDVSGNLVKTARTNSSGFYRLSDITPGTYDVEFVLPADRSFTQQDQGGDDTVDSDANASGMVTQITVGPGEHNSTIDAGVRVSAGLLANLVITGAELEVKPQFSPEIERHALYPGASTGSVSVTAFASQPGDTLTINGMPATSATAFDVGSLTFGDRVMIEVTEAGNVTPTTTYELVYLPVDFPRVTVTKRAPGFTDGRIYAVQGGYALTVDTNGVPDIVIPVSTGGAFDFKLHANGMRSYADVNGPRINGQRQSERVILDTNLNEIGRFEVISPLTQTDFHDFLILPNGDYVFMTYNDVMRGGERIIDAVIQVVEPVSYTVVFQWDSKDYLDPDDSYTTGADYAHINAFFQDTDGNYLVSLRSTNSILKIDATTGDVIWTLGGNTSDFEIIDPLGGFIGQHAVSRTAGGNILLFDNGYENPGRTDGLLPEFQSRANVTRVVEYALDEVNFTATLVFSHEIPGETAFATGLVQELAGGNIFVGWGLGPYTQAQEVTRDGRVVFEMVTRTTDGTVPTNYRTFHFPE
jgi:hypothetical protein